MRLPKKWSHIKINQFYELRAVLEMQGLSNIDKNTMLLSAISGMPQEYFENLTLTQLTRQISAIKFMDSMPGSKPRQRIMIGGRVYRVTLNPEHLTAAQLIDLGMFTKSQEQIVYNLHNILAVICVPLFSKYNGHEHKKHAQRFLLHANMEFAYGIAVFFCKLFQVFLNATKDYLETDMMKQIESLQTMTNTLTTGDGISHSIRSAEATT